MTEETFREIGKGVGSIGVGTVNILEGGYLCDDGGDGFGRCVEAFLRGIGISIKPCATHDKIRLEVLHGWKNLFLENFQEFVMSSISRQRHIQDIWMIGRFRWVWQTSAWVECVIVFR